MKETIKLGVTLLIIAAVAAGILAYSNSITGPIIAEREKGRKIWGPIKYISGRR